MLLEGIVEANAISFGLRNNSQRSTEDATHESKVIAELCFGIEVGSPCEEGRTCYTIGY